MNCLTMPCVAPFMTPRFKNVLQFLLMYVVYNFSLLRPHIPNHSHLDLVGSDKIKRKLIATHETAPLFLYSPIKLATYSFQIAKFVQCAEAGNFQTFNSTMDRNVTGLYNNCIGRTCTNEILMNYFNTLFSDISHVPLF